MSGIVREVTIGECRLILGDCREVLPLLDRQDLLLTDPPYGIGESSQRNATRGRLARPTDYGFYDWDSKPADDLLIEQCISAARSSVIWGGNYFGLPASSKWLVWDKINSGDFADCELAWTNLIGAVRIFRHMWNGMLRDSERNIKRIHPTQKPVALMSWCLQQAKNPSTVIDTFMGSGSAGVACVQSGLAFTGIELDPVYFASACERIENAYRQAPLVPHVQQVKQVQEALL